MGGVRTWGTGNDAVCRGCDAAVPRKGTLACHLQGGRDGPGLDRINSYTHTHTSKYRQRQAGLVAHRASVVHARPGLY